MFRKTILCISVIALLGASKCNNKYVIKNDMRDHYFGQLLGQAYCVNYNDQTPDELAQTFHFSKNEKLVEQFRTIRTMLGDLVYSKFSSIYTERGSKNGEDYLLFELNFQIIEYDLGQTEEQLTFEFKDKVFTLISHKVNVTSTKEREGQVLLDSLD